MKTENFSRAAVMLLMMLLTATTAGADKTPGAIGGDPTITMRILTEDGATGTVDVSYVNSSGQTVNATNIASGWEATTTNTSTLTITITPAAGCEVAGFQRKKTSTPVDLMNSSNTTVNNGVYTFSSTFLDGTYTIKFAPKSDYWLVSFDSGIGGSGTMAPQAIPKGGTANLSPCTFTNDFGNIFAGWNTMSDGRGTSYADCASITPTANITLYAQWSEGYTVHFDKNADDATGTMADQGILLYAIADLSANAFTREGYVFTGWNTMANGLGTSYADGQSVSRLAAAGETVTLYAQWSPPYTVHFDANGGTGTMADQTFFIGQRQALSPNTFTREGYIFVGWLADGSTQYSHPYTDGQSVINLTTTPYETVNLYAIWTPTYTVHFDANGGSGTMADQTFGYGLRQILAPNAFTREGYIFVGWLSSNGKFYDNSQSVVNLAAPGETVTLYARWRQPYTVHFDANGGSGTMADQTILIGDTKSLYANTFTREGYVFTGWNTEANGSGTAYTNGQEVENLTTTPNSTVNLYAQWTPTYTVHFNASGGSGTMADQTIGIGQTQALSANTFTREGYYFVGWNTRTDGLGTTYIDGQSVTDLTTTAGETVNLYAKWRETVAANYVDANGDTHTLTGCQEITPGYMPTMLSGNYIVKESVTYTSKVTLSGPTTIILANGKTMSIGTANAFITVDYALYGSGTNSLTIYGQSLDAPTAGSLVVYSTSSSSVKLSDGSYVQHSGNVKVINIPYSNNKNALDAGGSVTIDGGTFFASINSQSSYAISASGNITVSGGSVTANATGADSYGMRSASGSITLTWTRATDGITASSYRATNGTVTLGKRFAFDDGGTVTLATTDNMGGKTLRPAALVTFDTNGGSDVPQQPVIIGTAAIEPTLTGYDVSGWTLGGAAYDFATPVTEDITLTAHWTLHNYTITYDLAGGTLATANPGSYTINSADLTLTNPTRKGCIFAGWTGTDLDAATKTVTIASGSTGDRSYTATWTDVFGMDNDADGSADHPYVISTADGWNYFCDALQDNTTWNRFSGKTVKLDANIGTAENPVTRMAGSSGHDFCGTFDGDGHTLTVKYGMSEAPVSVQNAAPFSYVSNGDYGGAAIRNLHVAGNIYTSAKYAAGIVGQHWCTLNIENCRSSIVIHSSVSGDGTHGGLEGASNDALNITGCVFDGKLLNTATGSTSHCGGFVGYGTLSVSNSIYAPASMDEGETWVSSEGSATFVRNSSAGANCYYTKTFGTEQGLGYSTASLPANIGTAGKTYSVSGIQAYTHGLGYDGRYFMTPEAVSLADNATNDVDAINGYFAEVTLTGRTLFKDGKWNTLCLPFGVTISGSDLDGAEARSLSTASLADGTLTLDFSTPVDALVAGTPYIIRWTRASDYEDDDAHNIVSPTFNAVTIDATDRPFTSTDGKVTFRGTYQPIEWTATNTSILFLGAANTLYYPQPSGDKNPSINACRAYFELSDGTQQARQFVLNFGKGDEASGITTMDYSIFTNSDDAWYTLDGVRLGGKPSAKGVYINSGRKVVIN